MLPAGRFVLLVLFLDLTSETHWIIVYIGWDFILDIYIEIFDENATRWDDIGWIWLNNDICLIKRLDMLEEIFWTFWYVGIGQNKFYVNYWTLLVVLDEKDKLYKRLLDNEMIGWETFDKTNFIRIIGHRDMLDDKYWTGGFVGLQILGGRIFWMKNIGR